MGTGFEGALEVDSGLVRIGAELRTLAFFFASAGFWPLAITAVFCFFTVSPDVLAKRFWNRSTRPAVSTNFWRPVKKG